MKESHLSEPPHHHLRVELPCAQQCADPRADSAFWFNWTERCQFDPEDADLIRRYTWRLSTKGRKWRYAMATIGREFAEGGRMNQPRSVGEAESDKKRTRDPFVVHALTCPVCRFTSGVCPAGAELLLNAALAVLTP